MTRRGSRFSKTANIALDARDWERVEELFLARPDTASASRSDVVRAALENLASLIHEDPTAWDGEYLAQYSTPFGYDRAPRIGVAITAAQRADLKLIANHLELNLNLSEATAIAVRLLCDAYECPRERPT